MRGGVGVTEALLAEGSGDATAPWLLRRVSTNCQEAMPIAPRATVQAVALTTRRSRRRVRRVEVGRDEAGSGATAGSATRLGMGAVGRAWVLCRGGVGKTGSSGSGWRMRGISEMARASSSGVVIGSA